MITILQCGECLRRIQQNIDNVTPKVQREQDMEFVRQDQQQECWEDAIPFYEAGEVDYFCLQCWKKKVLKLHHVQEILKEKDTALRTLQLSQEVQLQNSIRVKDAEIQVLNNRVQEILYNRSPLQELFDMVLENVPSNEKFITLKANIESFKLQLKRDLHAVLDKYFESKIEELIERCKKEVQECCFRIERLEHAKRKILMDLEDVKVTEFEFEAVTPLNSRIENEKAKKDWWETTRISLTSLLVKFPPLPGVSTKLNQIYVEDGIQEVMMTM